MSNQLVFIGTNLPVNIEQTVDGPEYAIGERRIPVVDTAFDATVVQPGSIKKDKTLKDHLGKFYFKDFQESVEELSLLPIAVTGRGRRLFPAYGEGDGELICYSNDGETPAEKVDSPIAECCGAFVQKNGRLTFEASCPKASWGADREKPECGEVLNVAWFDLVQMAPIRMQFRGTGISAFRAFEREYKKYRNIARLKGKKLSDYVVRISLENEGTYYRMVFMFEEAPELNPSELQPLLGWYLDNLFSRKDEEDLPVGQGSTGAPMGDVAAVVNGDSDMDGVDGGEAISV